MILQKGGRETEQTDPILRTDWQLTTELGGETGATGRSATNPNTGNERLTPLPSLTPGEVRSA